MIVFVLQSIGSKCWPRDYIGVLVFGITLPYEFNKLNNMRLWGFEIAILVNALMLLIFGGEVSCMINEGSSYALREVDHPFH